jgi:hypothetical protein
MRNLHRRFAVSDLGAPFGSRDNHLTGGRQFRLNRRESSGHGVAAGLFPLQHASQQVEASREFRNGPVSILDTSFHFAFTQGQHVRAEFYALLLLRESAIRHPLFEQGAPPAFVEGLHPEGFGDVRDRLGEPMKGRRA